MLPVQQEAARVDWSPLADGGRSAMYWGFATELQTGGEKQREQSHPICAISSFSSQNFHVIYRKTTI